MKTLIKSSNFWNAIIGSIIATLVYVFTKETELALTSFVLFGVRAGDKWHQNYMNAKATGIGGGGLQKPKQSFEADGGIGGGGLQKPKE